MNSTLELSQTIDSFCKNGYGIIENIYTEKEVSEILQQIEENEKANANFRKSNDVFAIRQVIKEIPELKNLIFNKRLKRIINEIGGSDYFLVKSIYFDKPETSNWVVPYHQDLTIALEEKIETENYINWTSKHNQVAVQPPLPILENIFTVRVHLDDTTKHNGAVKVITSSHKNGIILMNNLLLDKKEEVECEVSKGGIMLMKPLTLHASTKTTNNKRRRVIHIEFSNQTLPNNLKWSEYSEF
ncbi:phytanoyl-CoA dioxygenase family protein [Flavobacterium sp. H122]|uniref:phytanoyl-CoA dioxygenase family protein n=1 Tax=Flavobacterium sp. H122 TaxID=2529860 RepID=UPI0010AA3B84|nr:phytanoyl-CoA dioxygenase family protein [Flavobacterium sp. H122]